MNVIDEISGNGLTTESYEECMNTIVDKKNNDVDIDWSEICSKYNLNISPDNLRRVSGTIFGGAFVTQYFKDNATTTLQPKNDINNRKEAESDQNNMNEMQSSVETSINKDGTYSSKRLIYMNDEESKDPEFILKAHGFNSLCWKIVSLRNNIRQVVTKVEGVSTLYASYLTVKPLNSQEMPLSKIDEFFNKLDRNYSLPELIATPDYIKGNKLLLIDIADLHMNLQSSVFTTCNKYDCDIAESLFFYVIKDIMSRTRQYNLNKIVFVIGGDMMNSDNLDGTTTKGTRQNNDIHYYDAYERLCAMTIKAIDLLKENCLVDIIFIPGNHDEVTSYKLAKYIQAWFRHEPSVTVDYKPIARKYVKYGNTLLCFSHDGKVNKLPALIADEARNYWSEVKNVEVFLQHFHSEQVLVEENNIRIQRLPTISAKSKWTMDKGFNSKRQCKSFLFDYEDGLTDVLYTPIKTEIIME